MLPEEDENGVIEEKPAITINSKPEEDSAPAIDSANNATGYSEEEEEEYEERSELRSQDSSAEHTVKEVQDVSNT